ncbi:alpha/beta fold hydrolase [Arthrobacter sp. GCM10027362]|uniref:alpha/beta fold hydrolase n=1 Tax=Arthrobacter sp. GCM10027362 TaxID=3273379 RepID=UPI0036367E4B
MTRYTHNALDGVRLAFDDVPGADGADGAGGPLLLVHGSGLSKAAWRGLGYRRALAGRRLIALDMRGHGRSAKPHEDAAYTTAAFVADVEAVLDACGVGSAHYFGYSFGARVGFALTAARPGRIRSLACLGGTYRALAGQAGDLFFPGYLEALDRGGMGAFLEGWAARAGRPLDPATAHAFGANDPAALAAYFRQGERLPGLAEDEVARLQVPALLLAGSRDHPRAEDSRRAAELMPHAVYRELPGLEHATSFAAVEPVTALLRDFLQSQACPA